MRPMLFTAALLAAAPVIAGGQTAPAPRSPVAVVQSQVEAFNRGDVTAFAAHYAESVEVFDLPDAKPNLVGRTALIARYAPMFAKYKPRATVLTRIVRGAFVIDDERTDVGKRSFTGAVVYQVEGGLIRRVWCTPE